MQIDRVRLIAEMARQNMGNAKLSELSGVSCPAISAIRNGKRCYARTAQKLADALGVSLDYLAGKEDRAIAQ